MLHIFDSPNPFVYLLKYPREFIPLKVFKLPSKMSSGGIGKEQSATGTEDTHPSMDLDFMA